MTSNIDHESDQSRYASECDRCETDGHLHTHDCPNNPRRLVSCSSCGQPAHGVSESGVCDACTRDRRDAADADYYARQEGAP